MARHGDGAKPIWMTELGWNTQSTAPGSCTIGMWAGQKPLGVTEAQQAEFLAQAYRCLAADPIVGVALWFGMQDIPGSATRAATACTAPTARPSRPRPPSARSPAGSPRSRAAAYRHERPADPGRQAARRAEVRRHVRRRRQGGRLGRRRRHPAARVLRRRQVRALVRRRRTPISPWWDSRYWKRGKHTLTFKAEDEAGNKASRRSPSTRCASSRRSGRRPRSRSSSSTRHGQGHRRRHARHGARRHEAARQGLRRLPEAGRAQVEDDPQGPDPRRPPGLGDARRSRPAAGACS